MHNKERFMQYAKWRLKLKEYEKRKFLVDLNDVQIKGIERCSRGKWRMHQK